MNKIGYNRAEAADALGISIDKLDQEYKAGRICPKYTGKKPLYSPDELKRWLESLPSEPKSA
ncbi:hypothetical protein [Mycobacterium sp. NPDC050853]|uniref:hypothetical protein n=1 Tax=Mycobacterium sp. NPDC050853 TaxID=3155160 RepID=UPI0033D050F2